MSRGRKLAGVVLMVLAAGMIGYLLLGRGGFEFDEAAEDGSLEGLSQSQIEELMNRKVEESMLAISINSNPRFEDGRSEGNLRIENPANNRYHMKVEIVREDTKEVIYATKGIRPGQKIEKDRLDVELKKGEYACTATFTAYDDEGERIGEAGARITILVVK